jgi:hypothetical protein
MLAGRMEVAAIQDGTPFPFERLPCEAQLRIFTLLLKKEGLVHCISRLDPFNPNPDFPSPEELEEEAQKSSCLKKLFFWGKRQCSITSDGEDPNKVLAILTVSKRWYWLGVRVFYGLNTFSFSSLGEFGRFCTGIGLARLARVQNIELLLLGSQYLTAPPDERGKSPFSRRTYPLSWFADMYRLKTLVVHIKESGRMHIRRGYENPTMKKLLEAKTAGQPNARMTRALRCVQGIDYIYQLRGMEWIRLYDFNKALKAGRSVREQVRDWSFVEDITNVCTLPKPPKRQENSELEKLEPLLPADDQNWTPGDDDWKIVKAVYIDSNGRFSYDDLRQQMQNRDADVASYLPSVTGTGVIDISSDSSDDSDSDNSSSDGSDSDSEGHLPFSDITDSDSDTDSDSSSSSGAVSTIEISSDSDSDSATTGSPESRSRPRSSPSGSTSGAARSNTSHARNSPSKRESTPRRFALPERPATRTPGPAARARRDSTASGFFVSPGPRRPPQTPAARARRESTASGLFVTPGPSAPQLNQTPGPQNPQDTPIARERRESTASELFVTPGPSMLPPPQPQSSQSSPGAASAGTRTGPGSPLPQPESGVQGQGLGNSPATATATLIPPASTNTTATPNPRECPVIDLTDDAAHTVDLTGADDHDEALALVADAHGSGNGGNGNGTPPRVADSLFGDSPSPSDDDNDSDSDPGMGSDMDMDLTSSSSSSDSDTDTGVAGLGARGTRGNSTLSGGGISLAGVQDLDSESDDEGEDLSDSDSDSDDENDNGAGAGGLFGGLKRGWRSGSNGGSPGKRPRLGM